MSSASRRPFEQDIPDADFDRIDYDPALTEIVADALAGWEPADAPLLRDVSTIILDATPDSPIGRGSWPASGLPLSINSCWRPGLAASSGGDEILVDRHELAGVTVRRRIFASMGLVDITVESTRAYPVSRFPVLGLFRRLEPLPQPCLLFLMLPGSPFGQFQHSEVRIQGDDHLVSDELSLYDTPVEATQLPAQLLQVVTQTVAVAKLDWKEAWRQAALATPLDHPLREAVSRGLRGQPTLE